MYNCLMDKPIKRLTYTILLIWASFIAVSILFETPLAEESIDWISFLAGGFLVVDGVCKFLRSPKDPLYVRSSRVLRAIIGADVIVIHLAEFIWGARSPETASPLLGMVIDWMAFFFGIFLIAEATTGIIRQKGTYIPDQLARTFRIIIGTSVFTIHLLQFMRT
ncbi:MAG: hypothetical protein PHT95_01100 [Candidatus Omnitrophica bacterium]|nr:hypothetical protein [Candidatus Omnitrophota bacterium]